jgi:hypothetical protein
MPRWRDTHCARASRDGCHDRRAAKGRSGGPFHLCESTVQTRRRLTAARLQALLHYDPETGEFRWRKQLSSIAPAGAIAGSINKYTGYRYIMIDNRSYTAHHLAWLYKTGKWCRRLIDHRDLNRANNRWSNLRPATRSENNANQARCPNKSGFRGVSPHCGKWQARICKNGRQRFLGTYDTAQEAHAAYVAAARKLFGEFARPE